MHRKLYNRIGLGGTFDHFHQGHKHFLNFAGSLSNHLVIGLTDQKLTKQKPFSHSIDSFSTRLNAVRRYCSDQGISHEIVKLTDIYGPTLSDPSIEALCVTEETTTGAKQINDMREKLRLSTLPVHVSTMLLDETGQTLSSSRIRSGEISRTGRVYRQILQKPLRLTEKQRQFFTNLQGKLVTRPSVIEQKEKAPYHTCVVGDTTLEKFIKNKWYFSLGVFDGLQQRQPVMSQYLEQLKPTARVVNPPGTLTLELVSELDTALNQDNTQLLFVEGEEDIATVILVIILPLHSKIYYGQPHEGMVEIVVSEENKERFYSNLNDPSDAGQKSRDHS